MRTGSRIGMFVEVHCSAGDVWVRQVFGAGLETSQSSLVRAGDGHDRCSFATVACTDREVLDLFRPRAHFSSWTSPCKAHLN